MSQFHDDVPGSDLAGYETVSDWLPHAAPFFQTKSAFDWFVRRHRRELVESGALIPREGRSGSLVLPDRMAKVVVAIHKRRALGKA